MNDFASFQRQILKNRKPLNQEHSVPKLIISLLREPLNVRSLYLLVSVIKKTFGKSGFDDLKTKLLELKNEKNQTREVLDFILHFHYALPILNESERKSISNESQTASFCPFQESYF